MMLFSIVCLHICFSIYNSHFYLLQIRLQHSSFSLAFSFFIYHLFIHNWERISQLSVFRLSGNCNLSSLSSVLVSTWEVMIYLIVLLKHVSLSATKGQQQWHICIGNVRLCVLLTGWPFFFECLFFDTRFPALTAVTEHFLGCTRVKLIIGKLVLVAVVFSKYNVGGLSGGAHEPSRHAMHILMSCIFLSEKNCTRAKQKTATTKSAAVTPTFNVIQQ